MFRWSRFLGKPAANQCRLPTSGEGIQFLLSHSNMKNINLALDVTSLISHILPAANSILPVLKSFGGSHSSSTVYKVDENLVLR